MGNVEYNFIADTPWSTLTQIDTAKSAGVVQYTDCIPAEV